jgi:hypothetical protein
MLVFAKLQGVLSDQASLWPPVWRDSGTLLGQIESPLAGLCQRRWFIHANLLQVENARESSNAYPVYFPEHWGGLNFH